MIQQRKARFALIGAGFWAQYHLASWQELGLSDCVAVCDRSVDRAERLAQRHGVAVVYDDVAKLLAQEDLDFVDIVTDVHSHVPIARQALEAGVAAICQKPLAPTLDLARGLQELSAEREVPLLVHENWRWHRPLRRVKAILDSGQLGRLVRARIDYANSFPVFDNQPALKELERFIIVDMGTHILDVSRFLFGEATELYCQTRRIRHDIAGEDVATVMLRKESGLTVTCNMSYASRWEFDHFPQTMLAIEGEEAGLSLKPNYRIEIYGRDGIQNAEDVDVPAYPWCDPRYLVAHSCLVDCQRNLLNGLTGQGKAETTIDDNIKTLELVFGSYDSAEQRRAIVLS
jgi:predicted dehydrogenase